MDEINLDNSEKMKKYYKEYYEKNKKRINKRNKKYYEENKEKINEQKKKYYEENKERINKLSREYKNEHKEKYLEYKKKWRDNNKEKSKKYYESIREQLGEQNRKYGNKFKHNLNKEKSERIKDVIKLQTAIPKGYRRSAEISSNRKGVTYDKSQKLWQAQLTINGKSIKKRFKTEKEAIEYREYLEDIYYTEEQLKIRNEYRKLVN